MREGRDDPAFERAAQRGIAPGDTVPTGQIGTVADVVAAALYLCSAYGAYFSGSTMTIDGGENLRHSLGGPPFSAPRTRMLNRQPREVRPRQCQRRVAGREYNDDRPRGSSQSEESRVGQKG